MEPISSVRLFFAVKHILKFSNHTILKSAIFNDTMNSPDAKHPYTRLCYWGISLLLVVLVIALPPVNVFSYDVFGYYMYLPLGFKYHDLTIQDHDQLMTLLHQYKASETFYQALQWDNGNWVMRYPIGLAVLYAPFYFIGDLMAGLSGYPADGFSRPYQLSVLYGALFYTLVGLYVIRKVLLHFFSDRAAALTLLGIGLGTNYFFHVSMHGQGVMSHNVLFALYAIILYLTIRWHSTFQKRYLFAMALAVGLAALCRATEIVCVLIPLLYGVYNKSTFKAKWRLLLLHKGQVAAFALIVMGVGFIQLAYYKYASGHFIINPYAASNPGEGFEFLHPYLLEVLFSFRKGWFIYTPLMVFAVLGFVQLYKHNRALFTPVLVYSLINLYLVASWSCWWFSGCFGNRALIACYAALSLPLGYFFEWVFTQRLRAVYLALVVIFIGLNLFQSWQMRQGILDSTYMSRAYYLSIFLQTTPPTPAQTGLLLKSRNYADRFTKEDSLTHTLGFARLENFEGDTSFHRSDSVSHSGRYSLIAQHQSEPVSLEIPYRNLTRKSYTWVRASVWVYTTAPADRLDVLFQISMKHKGWEFQPVRYPLNQIPLTPHRWHRLVYYYLTPDNLRSTEDPVCISFTNKGPQRIYIDDLLLESFEPIADKSVF